MSLKGKAAAIGIAEALHHLVAFLGGGGEDGERIASERGEAEKRDVERTT